MTIGDNERVPIISCPRNSILAICRGVQVVSWRIDKTSVVFCGTLTFVLQCFPPCPGAEIMIRSAQMFGFGGRLDWVNLGSVRASLHFHFFKCSTPNPRF